MKINETLENIKEINTQLEEKTLQIDELNNKTNSLASGSPKGTFATLYALQSDTIANTVEGKKSIYVVTADGNWYYWNGSIWTVGGTYQSTGIADKSIKPVKTTFFEEGKNLINYEETVSGQFVNQTTGSFDIGATHRRTEKLTIKPNTKYTFSYRNKNTGANISNNVAFRYALYDNDSFIKGNLNEISFTTPSNVNKIAVSWLQTNDIDYNIQLEIGDMTIYETYNTVIPQKYLNLNKIYEKINELENNINVSSSTNIIFNEDFKTSIPSFFTNNGFSINNGLINIETGYDKQIYYNKEICLDRELIKIDIELKDLNSIIGIGFRSAIAGLLCECDFKNKKLIIRQGWSDPTSPSPPTVFLETPITFDLVLNRVYSIIVEKDTRKNCSVKLIDTITLEEINLDCIEKSTTSPVNAWGGACIVSIEGNFKINRFSFINNQPSSPLIAIYGDSFIEGTTLMPNIEKRYANLLKEKLNGDCIIGGKGGDTTIGIINKIDTYSKFKPKYTILSIGLNDTVFSAYKDRIETLVSWCKAINSIPILTTITRNMANDNLTFLKQVNEYVRNSGYRYIDFAKTMSMNGDGETQNSELFLSDKIHPNIEGHNRMYKKILIDIYDIINLQ